MGYLRAMIRKVLVSIPDDELERIDAEAEREGLTRSELLRRAMRERLASVPRRPIDDPRARLVLARLARVRGKLRALTTTEILAARDRGRRA